MKKSLILGLTGIFILLGIVSAVCPVCTIAVGAGVGVLRAYGVDDLITGLWLGALIVSSVMWFLNWLNKKNVHFIFKKISVIVVFYAIFLIPLYWMGLIGHPENVVWGIDKIILGVIWGTLIFILATLSDSYLKKINEGKAFVIYQKVFIPLIFLVEGSAIIYLLLRIQGA
jgi:hypothetical protein